MPIFFESTAASIPDDPGEIVPSIARLALDARDLRTQALELVDDILVATVQVIDVIQRGGPAGGEGGDDQGRAGPDVGHRNRCAAKRAGPGHDGAAALYIDVGPELAQFWYVLEAVFEDGLRHMAPSVRLRHQANKGRLQIGRESGMRPGRHVDRLQVTVAPHPETVRP